ncbi:unnamed protein product [Chilo suppressalis]|uniref:Kinesin motor domain-containing protein n=1 Tax=Chilo suppressalis TaxID=168631 RepID=A0ABN8B4F2_CHISP|nr:unnamed protein product [Chilo suppressalis]
MSKVKLGIRVRPFTERELRSDKERTRVVDVVDDNTVTITNVKVSVSGAGDSRARVRRYSADYAFDSACLTTHPAYASQEKLFMHITVAHLMIGGDKVQTRRSPCRLQKCSFTPLLKDPIQHFSYLLSFLEIYNERVHDLLAGESAPIPCHSLPRRRGNARKDLRVREHPGKGPYVQNLRRVAIHSVEALLVLLNEGAKRRRTAATRRNTTSSRSHALLELATHNATLHLADLAGSEKAGWEGCGGRQKEGANINKSLVALSNVISALVSGGGRGRFVPYRDSALTWLLKDCFTGGANTFIIATVSPSVACYGESASTLRWAARARQLPDARTVAPSPLTRPQLLAQHTRLLAELARNYIHYVPETGKLSYDDNHWKLNKKTDNSELDQNKAANIGNIMNLLQSKTDTKSESTASSAASGSSDVINNHTDKLPNTDIADEITKELDDMFVPNLERTQSINDLKIIAPLRHKRRQYKSQEILPIDETVLMNQSISNALPGHSGMQQVNYLKNNTDKSLASPISVHYDNNQRAEIVASVTERLYNKMKKKEEAAALKMESVIDKKIMEPLSELRICTNARQRLMEISQKALRNKRKIGIPAHTQTRKLVTRVRDQGIDVQTDLEAYLQKNNHEYILRCDVATETLPMTPRCKEVAVGSKYGMINFNDRSTITEEKKIVHRSSLVMTDVVRKCDSFTQTHIVPPPRRKRRGCCCKCSKTIGSTLNADDSNASILSINISQSYPVDSETQSSDDNSENQVVNNENPSLVNTKPDLLTNHSTSELKLNIRNIEGETIVTKNFVEEADLGARDTEIKTNNDFSDSDECSLPRVTVEETRKIDSHEIKDMILGRNENIYPYNIILSPPRDRDQSKILVKFQDTDVPMRSVALQTSLDECDENVVNAYTIKDRHKSHSGRTRTDSNSTESSKADSDTFVWKRGFTDDINTKPTSTLRRSHTPVYKSKSFKNEKSSNKLHKEFIRQNQEIYTDECDSLSSIDNNKGITSSDSTESRDMFSRRRCYLESMLNIKPNQGNFRSIEQELLNSCDNLERSVNKYEKYVAKYRNTSKGTHRTCLTRTPTEYLQHLIQLRREVVKGDYKLDSSTRALPK